MARILMGEFNTIVKTVMTVDEEKFKAVVMEHRGQNFDDFDADMREKIMKDSETRFTASIVSDDMEPIAVDLTDFIIAAVCGKSANLTPEYLNDLISKVQN